MSDQQTQLKNWLLELGAQQGANFSLDEEGRCFINANDKTNINIYGPKQSEHFYINIELTPLPAEGAEPMFRTALGLNLFQQHTRGTAIALDERSAMMMLCYSGEYDTTNFTDFCNILNNMIELSEKIIEQLQASQVDEQAQFSEQMTSELPLFAMPC